MTEPKMPSHAAYVIRDKDDGTANWREIGVAFEHKDGKGFDVLLDAVPVSGKVTLRKIEPKSD